MKNGMVVATAVLTMFGTMGCSADDGDTDSKEQEMVMCEGINECMGTSDCATEGGNACEGQNECAGMGWNYETAEVCKEKGGMILETES